MHLSCTRSLALPVSLALVAAQGAEAPRSAAAAAPAWAAKVDALFAEWDKPDSPGCALGVIQDGRLVHARGFGQASLEHSVPITPRTVFDIGSTSKQFTAASIGLLVQDGKLNVDDEIHDWVPELAPWDELVTLDQMLHHVSGIPDYIGLMMRPGLDPADHTTPKDALDALAEVDRLHFVPGAKFEYSNSNFFLLSLVIERASETTFPEFVRQRIFAPLGMKSTLLMHHHALVVPHRACGYARIEGGGFEVAMSDWEQLGDGAVQTTVEDLARWDGNFYSHQVGGDALHAFLHETGKLNDGQPIEYGRGLFVDTFHGEKRVSHAGSWAGYRAELMRFPERKTSIVCLFNLAGTNPVEMCEKVAALVLAP